MSHTSHLVDEELVRLIDEPRSSDVAVRARVHLAECDRCRARLREFTDADARLAETTPDQGDWAERTRNVRARARLESGIAAAADGEWSTGAAGWQSRPLTRRFSGAITAGLAVATVFVAIAGATLWRSRTNVERPSMVASPEEPGALPNRALTPGATRTLAVAELCGNSPAEPSPVPQSVRQEVLRNYRMEHVPDHEYELDYLVTPDLGGAPDARNLWPERYGSRVWNARVKDQLEDLLPQLVCQGEVDLATAQRDIATDWIAAYKKYFRTDHPIGLSTRSFSGPTPIPTNN